MHFLYMNEIDKFTQGKVAHGYCSLDCDFYDNPNFLDVSCEYDLENNIVEEYFSIGLEERT